MTNHHDFEQLLKQSENYKRRLELIRGVVVEKQTGTFIHGYIVGHIATEFVGYLHRTKLGLASTDARFMPNPNNDFRPDISIVMAGTPLVGQGPMPGVPDIAIEVQSPDQSVNYMRDRAAYYLRLGVKMVWLVYTKKYLVEVIMSEATGIYVDGEMIIAEPLLPGFTMAVKDVFEVL